MHLFRSRTRNGFAIVTDLLPSIGYHLELSPQALFEGTRGKAQLSEDKIKPLIDPLLEKGSYYLVAEENNKLIGWILVGTSRDQFSDRTIGFIYELYVLKEFRGNGVSKLLLNDAIDRLKKAGYSEIRLSVFAENPAIHLYRQFGFSERTIRMSLEV